jgi:hypothetical protein
LKYVFRSNQKYIVVRIIIKGRAKRTESQIEAIEIIILLIFQCKKFLNNSNKSTDIDLISFIIFFIVIVLKNKKLSVFISKYFYNFNKKNCGRGDWLFCFC